MRKTTCKSTYKKLMDQCLNKSCILRIKFSASKLPTSYIASYRLEYCKKNDNNDRLRDR